MPQAPHEAVVFPLANSETFCQTVLDDLEYLFREQFGKRWTPEAQQLFQGLRKTCIDTARRIDGGAPEAIAPLRQAVLLTNYPQGR